jgi:hypothetical protein
VEEGKRAQRLFPPDQKTIRTRTKLSDLVNRLGGAGTGFAPILRTRRKNELNVTQVIQSNRVVISMDPLARSHLRKRRLFEAILNILLEHPLA